MRAHAVVVRRLTADLEREHGISIGVYDVLLVLYYARPRGLRIYDLGERVVLSQSRVSRLVDEMLQAGLLRREPDPTDGRAWLAVLTPKGISLFRRAAKTHMHGIDSYFSQFLSDHELDTIERGLDRVLDGHGDSIPDLSEPARLRRS